MRPFRVEPNQVLHQDDVELPGFQQKRCMEIDELFLDGSVEPFAVSIHLRGAWIRMVMLQVQLLQTCCKVFLELRAVVREHMLERDGEDHLAEPEELFCSLRCMGSGGPCETESAVEIFERDDISP